MNSASRIWTFAFVIIFGYAAPSSNAQPSNADRVEKNQLVAVSDSYDTRWKNDATDLEAILRSPPREYIKDLANVLSIEHTENIQAAISYHRQTSTNQIAVLTIPSLKSRSLEGLSLSVARAWGIGTKESDNGVLLLIAMKERKIRIEVGYGLEGALTDAIAGSIIRNEMTPNFKIGAYGFGTWMGIEAIIEAIEGEYNVKERSTDSLEPVSPLWALIICALLFFFYIGLPLIGNILESRHRRKYKEEHGREPPGYYESSYYQNRYGGGSYDSGWGGGGFDGGFGGGGFGGGGASGGW